jgi:hypothetical protein
VKRLCRIEQLDADDVRGFDFDERIHASARSKRYARTTARAPGANGPRRRDARLRALEIRVDRASRGDVPRADRQRVRR